MHHNFCKQLLLVLPSPCIIYADPWGSVGSEEPPLVKKKAFSVKRPLFSERALFFNEKVHSFTKKVHFLVKVPLFHQKVHFCKHKEPKVCSWLRPCYVHLSVSKNLNSPGKREI